MRLDETLKGLTVLLAGEDHIIPSTERGTPGRGGGAGKIFWLGLMRIVDRSFEIGQVAVGYVAESFGSRRLCRPLANISLDVATIYLLLETSRLLDPLASYKSIGNE